MHTQQRQRVAVPHVELIMDAPCKHHADKIRREHQGGDVASAVTQVRARVSVCVCVRFGGAHLMAAVDPPRCRMATIPPSRCTQRRRKNARRTTMWAANSAL